LSILKSTLELQISQLRQEYQEKKQLLDEYLKNTEAIDKNNKLDLEIRSLEMQIRHNINTKENNIQRIESHSHNVKAFTQCVNEREELIKKIEEESKLMRHWRIYLDMVGKNGISKMVLRKTLPIINAQLVRLLNGVCDFNVEVCINERNDVMFYLIKDGVKSDLTSGSGFERTAASLALRSVLSTMSTLPRLNILVIDEILGRVAKDNFDNMKLLYDKILENYDAILQISHLDEIKDWHQTIITVRKDVNVSQIVVKQQK
jgi:DNA repair exonuclease SbcCD ATPase subunit